MAGTIGVAGGGGKVLARASTLSVLIFVERFVPS